MSEQLAFEKLKPGFAYLQLALNAAFVVNGGALVALYPIAQWLPPLGQQLVALTALIFVAGIYLAYCCAITAFRNFEYAYAEEMAENDTERHTASEGSKQTREKGLRLGRYTYGCFAVGAIITVLIFVIARFLLPIEQKTTYLAPTRLLRQSTNKLKQQRSKTSTGRKCSGHPRMHCV